MNHESYFQQMADCEDSMTEDRIGKQMTLKPLLRRSIREARDNLAKTLAAEREAKEEERANEAKKE
eukprot:UN27494